jgi:hypothetical protein
MALPELNTDYGYDLLGKYVKAAAVKRGLLENTILENKAQNAPEMAKLEMERAKQETETGAYQLENLKTMAPIVKANAFMDYLHKSSPNITWQNYEQSRQHLDETAKGLGVKFQLPSAQEIAAEAMAKDMTPETYFEQLKAKTMRSLEERKVAATETASAAHMLTALKGEKREIAGIEGTTGKVVYKGIKGLEYGDGTEAKGQQLLSLTGKEGASERDDKYIEITQKNLQNKPLTPDEQTFIKSYERMKTLGPTAYGEQRYKMIMDMPVSAYDTNTGTVGFVTREQINESPGRYVGAELGTKIRSKKAIFDEIEVASQTVRQSLDDPKITFSQEQTAKLSYVMKDRDTTSALGNFLTSNVGKSLTPAQRNYVTALVNLKESSYALRNISGMGQGSDEMRRAIANAIPNILTPNKPYAKRQLDLFDNQVQALRSGVPGLGASGKNVEKPIVGKNYVIGDLYQGKRILGINKETKQLNVEDLGVVGY